MKSLSVLSEAHHKAIDFIAKHEGTLLYGPMGSGKTVTALAGFKQIVDEYGGHHALVVSTSKIVKTVWPQEPGKWEELAPFYDERVFHFTGADSEAHRAEQIAKCLGSRVGLLCINFEMLPWFCEQYLSQGIGFVYFDTLIIDECTKLKAGGKAFKALRKYLPNFTTRVAMTGTPVDEHWKDLFYQMMLVDTGRTFGKNKAAFIARYFRALDPFGRQLELREGASKELAVKINPYFTALPEYSEDLPPLSEHYSYVDMPAKAREYYKALEHDYVHENIVVESGGVLTQKLQQIASGFVYWEDDHGEPMVTRLHKKKIYEAMNWCDRFRHVRRVVAYQFEEEKLMLLEELLTAGHSSVIYELDGKCDKATLHRWRTSRCGILFIHPKSAGHGVDLTASSTMLILSPIWSRDQRRQLIARIWRRGQKEECLVTQLLARDTIDSKIVAREAGKATKHQTLMEHLREHGHDV